MMVDSSSGNPDVDSSYVKYTYGVNKDKGTVYSVVGNSGKHEPENGNHMPCMLRKLADDESGSMILTVKGNTLTGTYYKADGTLYDKFAIVKKDTAIASSIHPLNGVEAVTVFPNPFKKEITLELSMKKNERLSISIRSVDGKIQSLPLWNGNVSAGRTQLHITDNISSLPAGNYLLQIENTEGARIEKIVKQ
jgi:hypothetical protein